MLTSIRCKVVYWLLHIKWIHDAFHEAALHRYMKRMKKGEKK